MSSLSYAIRDADGAVVRGQTSLVQAQTAGTPQSVLPLHSAKDISLNLSPTDIAGYVQDGDNLVIHLVSGETVTLQNYFVSVDGEDRDLFLSKDGQFHRADLGEAVQDQYFAQYEAISTTEKWSAYDELTFLDLERVEPVVAPLAVPFSGLAAGLLGVGGAAVAATALSGGDGDDTQQGGTGEDTIGGGTPSLPSTPVGEDPLVILPTVDNADVTRVIGGTGADTVTITGTGEAGSQVVVQIGTSTETTTVGADGTWSTIFDPTEIPADGVYTSTVVVTAPGGTVYNLDGPSVDIDTTPPDVSVMDGTVSTGDLVNEADHTSGHVISGTGEPGAALTVEIDGTTHSTTVLPDGTWAVTFASSELTTGEYTTGVTIISTDARGNVTTVTDTLQVDTIAPGVLLDTVEGDDIINATEASDGVTLAGTGEAGSTLTILFEGVTQTVTVANDGTWSATYDAASIGTGTYNSDVQITATDLAGNSHTETFTVLVDTENTAAIDTPIAGDNMLNASEHSGGLTLTGTADPGASVAVTLEGVTQTVTAAADGSWTTTYSAGAIPAGTYDSTVTVSATDAAGNTSTTSETFRVDTEISVGLDSNQLGGDDTANASEVAAGFSLTGTAEPSSTVAVTLEGVTETVTAASDGTWTATFAPNSLPQGTYNSTVTAVATDAAGNSLTTTGTVHVDTEIAVALDDNQVGGDDIANAAEVAAGFALTGTAEPGSTVVVSMAGASHTVTTAVDGTWSATFTAADIPQGEYDATVTATATDAAGNSETTTGTVRVDTTTSIDVNLSADVFSAPVNAAHMQNGIVLDGTTEPNAKVVVTVEGVVREVTADASGNWSVTYENGALPEGTYTANASLSVTDAAGNTTSVPTSFAVDTEITNPVLQSVNTSTSTDGVTSLTLETEAQDYAIHALNQDGTSSALNTTEVALGGNESLFLINPEAPDGTHLVVASTDDAGNKSDTLLLLDDNVTNAGTLDHAALGSFNIESIEMTVADGASLTLTEAQIRDLSETSDTLTIHGDAENALAVSDAVKTNQTVDVGGETYDVYTVGNDGVTLIVDQDITVTI